MEQERGQRHAHLRPLGNILALVAGLALLVVPGAAVAAPAPCQMAADFPSLPPALAQRAGACLTPPEHAAGDVTQLTTRGMLVWRAATFTLAFTDGQDTSIDGPLGVQTRPNPERFPWEAPATVRDRPRPPLLVVARTDGPSNGSLRFIVTGQGFRPDEPVLLGGHYAPLQGGPGATGCRTRPLGPLRLQADGGGAFVATLAVPDPGTSVNDALRAVGAVSGPSTLAISYLTPDC